MRRISPLNIIAVATLLLGGCSGSSSPGHPETDCIAVSKVSQQRQVSIIEPVMSQWVARDGYAPSSFAWLQRAADNTAAVCIGFPILALNNANLRATPTEVCGRSSAVQYLLPPGVVTVATAEQCAYKATIIEGFHGTTFGPATP
jgi:hypothetical protein